MRPDQRSCRRVALPERAAEVSEVDGAADDCGSGRHVTRRGGDPPRRQPGDVRGRDVVLERLVPRVGGIAAVGRPVARPPDGTVARERGGKCDDHAQHERDRPGHASPLSNRQGAPRYSRSLEANAMVLRIGGDRYVPPRAHRLRRLWPRRLAAAEPRPRVDPRARAERHRPRQRRQPPNRVAFPLPRSPGRVGSLHGDSGRLGRRRLSPGHAQQRLRPRPEERQAPLAPPVRGCEPRSERPRGRRRPRVRRDRRERVRARGRDRSAGLAALPRHAVRALRRRFGNQGRCYVPTPSPSWR